MAVYLTPAQKKQLGIPSKEDGIRKKRSNLEDLQQKAVVRWFRMQYPKYAYLLFAIPNGYNKSKGAAGAAKGSGLTAGIPDKMLAVARQGYHGLFLEGKIESGEVSDEQKLRIADLRQQGYRVEVYWSFEEAMSILNDYMNEKTG